MGTTSEAQPRADRAGHTIRPGRPTVRTTFQLLADVKRGGDDSWKQALKICGDWLGRKYPEQIPDDVYRGESIELEMPGQSVGCIAIPELGLWTARVQMPDAPFGDLPAIAGRTWTTEIALQRDDSGLRFACRNICASLPNCDAPITYTTPVIVTDLADRIGLGEVRPLDGRAWMIKAEGELDQLHSFLENAARTLPVYLISDEAPGLDVEDLARRLIALAHVVVLPDALIAEWTKRVGGEWSIEPGAVRTYRPGLRFDEDSPMSHPMVAEEKIQSWRLEELEWSAAFARYLVEQAYITCVGKKMDWGRCLFYADARAKQAERLRAAAGDAQEWRGAYEAEIAALKAKLDESIKESETFNDDAIQATRDRDLFKEESARLRMHNDALRAALSAKTGQPADAAVEIPKTYEVLPEWVEKHLMGRLLLHPRAKRGLRDADYDDPELVYKSLLLLANEFRDMRRGDPTMKPQFEKRLTEMNLHLGRSISPSGAGQQGEEYFAKYPLGSGRTVFFELHLRKGNSKQTQYCLAIYFFWDEDTEQVVVGWLPSHLDNRMT